MGKPPNGTRKYRAIFNAVPLRLVIYFRFQKNLAAAETEFDSGGKKFSFSSSKIFLKPEIENRKRDGKNP
jgi:hypothetical protein